MPEYTWNPQEIFVAALRIADPVERENYIIGACQDDVSVLNEVRILLVAHSEEEQTMLEIAPQSEPPTTNRSEESGDFIGPYELVEQLGEGGFGTVWKAEQHHPVRRIVALKIIKLGMDTREVIARFEQERQALALMDHPGIAKVLDAGATKSGRPFFVMELVSGHPITTFCDTEKLKVRERLELFIQVCAAIQHAHQKGVIHRDIKPSNILVVRSDDDIPAAKVIDFGIAKATAGKLTDKTLFTAAEQLIGTPAYMSPEQAGLGSMQDIDTRSDVYALGVVLYELLTGRTPFDPRTLLAAGYEEMRRIIREQEPPRPSTRLGTLAGADSTTIAASRSAELPKLITSIRRELDWVVMKAIEKDRNRRYDTANGLARDIERFLRDEPVVARPQSTVYRIAKFVRRHKLGVTAAAAVIIAMLAGTGVSIWQALVATKARDEARQQKLSADRQRDNAIGARAQAEDILEFLLDDLRAEFEGKAEFALFKKVEKKVDDYYNKLGVDEANLPQMRRRAWALSNQGEVRMEARDLAGAETAFSAALAIMKDVAAKEPSNPLWQSSLAVAHGHMGAFWHAKGDETRAVESFTSYADIMTRLIEIDPDNEDWSRELAGSLDGRAKIRAKLGDTAGSAADHSRALEIRTHWAEKRPKAQDWAMDISSSMLSVAKIRQEQGDTEGAIELMTAGIAKRKSLADFEPQNTIFIERLISAYLDIAELHSKQKNHAAAGTFIDKVVGLAEALSKADPDNPGLQRRITSIQRQVSEMRRSRGELSGTEQALMQILDARARAAADMPDDMDAQRELAVAYSKVGRVRKARKDFTGASEASEKSIEIMLRTSAVNPGNKQWQRELSLAHSQLGGIRKEQGNLVEAEKLITRAFQILTPLLEVDPGNVELNCDLADTHGYLGSLRKAQDNLPGAIKSYETIIAILEPIKQAGNLPAPFEQFLRQAREKLDSVKAR